MAQKIEHQAAYILNRRAHQESSLILDVFSIQYGRLSIIAKGAMRSKKQWSALLQVFQPLLLSWSGRSSLKTLIAVEAPSSAHSLVYERLFCAYYLNEILLKLLPELESNAVIFVAYADALQSLNDRTIQMELVLRSFEIELLTELGFAPDFMFDVHGNLILEGQVYILKPQNGFERVNAWAQQAILFDGETLISLQKREFHQSASFSSEISRTNFFRQSKVLMRLLLNHALGGRKIKSRELFSKIKY